MSCQSALVGRLSFLFGCFYCTILFEVDILKPASTKSDAVVHGSQS
ncbi:unnamed protein product, partial [Staurois parvus]